jgi:zinc protease
MAAKYFNPDLFKISVVGASDKMLLGDVKMVPVDSLGFF